MGKLNDCELSKIEQASVTRKEKLRVLTSNKFNLDNEDHITALNEYINEFEMGVNKMRLFEGMRTGLFPYGASFFITIPAFILNYILTPFLIIGVLGQWSKRLSVNDFSQQLSDMKVLYNWCLKEGRDRYRDGLDNTNKLSNVEIKRMIELMAPFCSVDFMLAWKKVSKEEEPQEGLAYYMSYASSALSLFSDHQLIPGVFASYKQLWRIESWRFL